MRDKVPRKFLKLMAARFAILADPSRLEIIHCLMKGGEQGVTRIVEATAQSHSNVSKHLRHLRDAELVARRKEGLQVFYRLNDPLIEKLCKLVCESLLEEFDSQVEEGA
ncbi:MAG: metalloregulator ArsR/SmtB family transcription factor [Planctomycetes bacterium]|nr:metalloregulator ArsR/SmtB family transcription factor [Planctomycetota bacterium]